MAFSFGAKPATTGGGLFGAPAASNTSTQPTSLFGQPQQNQPAQQSPGLFGQPAQQQQQQQQQQPTSMFGQPAQQQTSGGLFGQPAQQQSTGGLFGQPQQNQQQNQQQPTSLFGQPQQNQQQQQQQPSMFGQTLQPPQQQQQQQNQLGLSQWQSQTTLGQAQPVTDQMKHIIEQWMPSSQSCKFKYYFYNKVSKEKVPYYGPAPREDPREWDDALKNKPGEGYVPALCVGFQQLGERITLQQRALSGMNQHMHEINSSLEAMMTKHDTEIDPRIKEAKRKHMVLKQRTLALATKVQIMRNKGYVMDQNEEALKAKLSVLEKSVMDSQIRSRAEEIWARMVQIQSQSKFLEKEMAKNAAASGSTLDEESAARAMKFLEDYATQLAHLNKEMEAIKREFGEYQKEQGQASEKKR